METRIYVDYGTESFPNICILKSIFEEQETEVPVRRTFWEWFSGVKKFTIKKVKVKLDNIAGAWLTKYPGCGGIRILNTVVVSEKFREKGHAVEIVMRAISEAKSNKIPVVTATVNHETPQMHHILTKLGFIKDFEFVNPSTGRKITHYHLAIQYEK